MEFFFILYTFFFCFAKPEVDIVTTQIFSLMFVYICIYIYKCYCCVFLTSACIMTVVCISLNSYVRKYKSIEHVRAKHRYSSFALYAFYLCVHYYVYNLRQYDVLWFVNVQDQSSCIFENHFFFFVFNRNFCTTAVISSF